MIKLTPAKCPQCGADIEVNPSLEKTICQYCGTTILVEEAIQKIELSGSVKVAGIKNRDDYLEQAKNHFKVGEYLDAKDCLQYIVVENPFDLEAFCEILKNDLEIMKYYNFDFQIDLSPMNPKYNKEAMEYLTDYYDIYERIKKIDEKEERAKYLGKYNDDVLKIDEKIKAFEERLKKNDEILKRLNEDYDKISNVSSSFLGEYQSLIGNCFHTTDKIAKNNFGTLSKFSDLSADGILYAQYNGKEDERYWCFDNTPVKNYEEIDQRFNEYCSKIDDIIKVCKEKQDKADVKDEKSRKRKRKWYRFSYILCILVALIVIALHVVALLEAGIIGVVLLIFIVDWWLFLYILLPWYESATYGLLRNRKR